MNLKTFILVGTLLLGIAQDSSAWNPVKAVGNTAKDLGNGAVNVAKDVGHGTADVAKDVGHGTADVAKGIGDGAVDLGKGAVDVGKDLGKGAVDVSKDFGKGAAGAVKDASGLARRSLPSIIEECTPLGGWLIGGPIVGSFAREAAQNTAKIALKPVSAVLKFLGAIAEIPQNTNALLKSAKDLIDAAKNVVAGAEKEMARWPGIVTIGIAAITWGVGILIFFRILRSVRAAFGFRKTTGVVLEEARVTK